VAGRAEVMGALAPTGPVYQAGTLSGNPVAVAAGLATLQHADAGVYARLDAVAEVLAAGVQRALAEEGVPVAVQRAGNLFSFAFGTADSCGWTGQGPPDCEQVRARAAPSRAG